MTTQARVLHYGLSSNLGGIETYLWNLSRLVDQNAYKFDFLYTDTGRPPALMNELRALGSQFYGVTPRRRNFLSNRRDLRDLFSRERFDILHFHANTASYIDPIRVALRSGVKVIVHSHNAGTSRSLATQFLHQRNRRTSLFSRTTNIAVSEDAGRWMFARRSRFAIVPNGIDTDEFRFRNDLREVARRSLGLGPDELLIGHIGAFLPAKNHAFVVEILSALEGLTSNSTLILVGTGPGEATIRSKVDDMGLQNRVHFLGRRDDIPALMSAMDAFILPSLHEGLPLVVLEAQASGLRTFVSEAVPLSALVLPTSHRLSLKSPADWASQLADTPSTALARSDAARRVSEAGFSVSVNAGLVQRLYARALSS